MVRSAAAIYAGAVVLSLVEGALPGGEPGISVVPGLAALLACAVLVALGARLPTAALFGFGPLGAVLIGVALATTSAYGVGAVLYMWPAVWTAYFFRTAGAVFIVGWIGLVHAVTLWSLPPEQASLDRWLDVEVAVLVVVGVVRALAIRNERLIAELAEEARIDPLTGMLNRRGLDERLRLELARAAREGTWLTVVRFDIDRFKQVNDSYGHAVGDRVLAWLGNAVTEQIRGVDAAARDGGDEFVVVLSRSDADAGRAFAERIRQLIADAGERHGVPDELTISVSAGVASCRAPALSRELLEEADRALYRAKAAGRNRVAAAGAEETAAALAAPA
jgi:diguanylate cyclase (GGDEF)-like protein